MKVVKFFKILNKKIEKYDKMASNPFTMPQPIILIWVEEDLENQDGERSF